MQNATIRYVLVATAWIGICLTVHKAPYPAPIVYNGGVAEPDRLRFIFSDFLFSYYVRIFTLVSGISVFMHVLTTLLGLKHVCKWAFGILAPSFALTGWHAYAVHFQYEHPGSLSVWGHIQLGLIVFAIGFTIADFMFSLPNRLRRTGDEAPEARN